VVIDYLSDPGLHRIPCYALASIVFQLWLECCKILAMKNKNIGIGLKKALLIELYLKSNQTWLIGLVA